MDDLARAPVDEAEMARRCVRYGDLVPCAEAFIDRRTPGCEGNENFAVIGPGVAEAAGQFVHVGIPHGFNVGGARQAPGTFNSQHSHEREEIFVVHSGAFRFHFGPDRQDGSIVLGEGDTISVPVRIFRGFENVGPGPGYMMAVLSGDDPGPVTWAPYVFEAARGTGLVLLEDGRLIDTAAGDRVPPGSAVMQPATEEEMRRFRRVHADDLGGCVARNEELRADPGSPLAGAGVGECPVIGEASPAEGIAAGPIADRIGLHLRRLRLAAGAMIAPHARMEEEVLFVHRGGVDIAWDRGSLSLGQGDHLTLPGGLSRSWRNAGPGDADIVVVRGGDGPAGPVWTAA